MNAKDRKPNANPRPVPEPDAPVADQADQLADQAVQEPDQAVQERQQAAALVDLRPVPVAGQVDQAQSRNADSETLPQKKAAASAKPPKNVKNAPNARARRKRLCAARRAPQCAAWYSS